MIPDTPARRGWRALVTTVNAVVAVGLLAVALLGTGTPWQGRVVLGLAGALWLAGVPLVLRATAPRHDDGPDPARLREDVVDGEPATVVDYDRSRARTGLGTLAGLTLVVLVAVALGVATADPATSLALGLPALALVGLPCADLVLAVRRPAGVALTPSRVVVRGWRTTAALGWDDVASVEVDVVGRRSFLRVRGRHAAPSWSGRHLPRAWPVRDPLPADDLLLDVEHLAGATPLVFRTAAHLVRHPGQRRLLGTPAGTALLRDPTLT